MDVMQDALGERHGSGGLEKLLLAVLCAAFFLVAVVALAATPAAAQGTSAAGGAAGEYADNPGDCLPGLFVRASGGLERISAEKYGYGRYEITDLGSGCTYALRGEGLEGSVGDFVSLRGAEPQAPGMAYEPGSDPPLLVVESLDTLADNRPAAEQPTGEQYGEQSPAPQPGTQQPPAEPTAGPDGATPPPAGPSAQPYGVLPDTGGASLLTLGAGVLLVAGGLIASRATTRASSSRDR